MLGYSEAKIEDTEAKGQDFFELLSENIDIEDSVKIVTEEIILN